MKTNLILKKVHLNLSVLAVTLSVTLLLSTVLCAKFMNQSMGNVFNGFVMVIMGMMMLALIIGLIRYLRHRKIDTMGKWTMSLLTFGIGVLAFLFVFEFFLKP
jgi:hypothetical protein